MKTMIIQSISGAKHRSSCKMEKYRRKKLEQLVMQLRTERCKLRIKLARGSHIEPEYSAPYPVDNIPDLKVPDLDNQKRIEILRRMAKIDAAIRKIQNGTYGHCQRCNTRIGSMRLAADPATIYCLNCQAKLEGRKRCG